MGGQKNEYRFNRQLASPGHCVDSAETPTSLLVGVLSAGDPQILSKRQKTDSPTAQGLGGLSRIEWLAAKFPKPPSRKGGIHAPAQGPTPV